MLLLSEGSDRHCYPLTSDDRNCRRIWTSRRDRNAEPSPNGLEKPVTDNEYLTTIQALQSKYNLPEECYRDLCDMMPDLFAVDDNVEANRLMLFERSAEGVRKYGLTTVDANMSADDWIQNAIEEMLDGANYLQAIRRSLLQQVIAVPLPEKTQSQHTVVISEVDVEALKRMIKYAGVPSDAATYNAVSALIERMHKACETK